MSWTWTDFHQEMYDDLKAFVDRRPAGVVVSRQGFQRRQRIGFITTGRIWDKAVEDGLIVKNQRGDYVKPSVVRG